MRQPERNVSDVLNQTWKRTLDVCPAASRAGPVSTARVKIIGTDTDTATVTQVTPTNFNKTKRYSSILPNFEDCIPQPDTAYGERDWRVLSAKDVRFLSDAPEALPFARTVPAVTQEELGIEQSGVHEVGGLRLALEPRDSAPNDEPMPSLPTQRVRRLSQPPLRRAWKRWEQQSPIIAIGTAVTFCFLSALLVSMLAP